MKTGRIIRAMLILLTLVFSGTTSEAADLQLPYDAAMIPRLAEMITSALKPFNPRIMGHVLSVDREGIFLSVGEVDQVIVGMRFRINIPNFDTGTVVQVDRVESDFCHTRLVSGPLPDVMYGAENVREDKLFELMVPSSTPEPSSGFLLQLADEVESGGGWKLASITNSVWRYAMLDPGSRGADAVCKISCTDDALGKPMIWVRINLPDGREVVDGYPYSGDWQHTSGGLISDSSHPDWYTNEAEISPDSYAVETFDTDGDGADELVVGMGNRVLIYRHYGEFLIPYLTYEFERIFETGQGYELGWLEGYQWGAELRIAARSPRHTRTGLLSISGRDVIEFPPIENVPVTSNLDNSSIVLANQASGYHMFDPVDVTWSSDDAAVARTLPASFSFFTEADFLAANGMETAFTDSESILWLETGQGWKNMGMMIGAGVWGENIDDDPLDELVTTSRNPVNDRLEFFDLTNEWVTLLEMSPAFNGRIIDVAFGDFNGDGERKPCILLAVGTSRKIIF